MECARKTSTQLVLFQLNIANASQLVQVVSCGADVGVPVAEVSIDTAAAVQVGEVIGIGKDESLHHPEVGLDEIEPGGLRRSEDWMYAKALQQGKESGIVMKVAKVV